MADTNHNYGKLDITIVLRRKSTCITANLNIYVHYLCGGESDGESGSECEIIDSDVHPWINGDVKGLLPYLSIAWRRRFERSKSTLLDHPLRPPLAGYERFSSRG